MKDHIFPLEGVEETFALIQKGYAALGKEDRCCLIKGEGGHQFYPDEAWPVMHKLME